MKLIAHRGNRKGPNPLEENKPQYIIEAIAEGYDCEIDVRYINGEYFLGHDTPDYKIELEFLFVFSDKLWIHCKNFEALNALIQYSNLNVVWHKEDHYTLTSKKFIWAYPKMPTTERCIVLMPEWFNFEYGVCYGICSDFVENIRQEHKFKNV